MKYRLYARKATEENLAQASKGYYRAASGYLLVYTAGRRPKGSIPIEAEQLSPADLAWLEDCNRSILMDLVEKDKLVQQRMLSFLDSLKAELAAEEEKRKGADHA